MSVSFQKELKSAFALDVGSIFDLCWLAGKEMATFQSRILCPLQVLHLIIISRDHEMCMKIAVQNSMPNSNFENLLGQKKKPKKQNLQHTHQPTSLILYGNFISVNSFPAQHYPVVKYRPWACGGSQKLSPKTNCSLFPPCFTASRLIK